MSRNKHSSRARTWALRAAALSAALSLWLLIACNLTPSAAPTYLLIHKDTAWTKFDSLEITWKDSLSGAGGLLFHGNPDTLAADNKFPVEGYHGQKIVIQFLGFTASQLAYQELRGFDGAHPDTVTRRIIPVRIVVDSPLVSTLTDLAVSSGVLVPAFSPAVQAYSDSVAADVNSVTVTPAGNGILKVNGVAVASGQASGPIALAVGKTILTVAVQLAGAEEKDYALTVIRKAPSSNADLQSLTVSAGSLSPAFSPAVKAYADSVANSAASVSIRAVTADSAATLLVNGNPVLSGADAAIALSVGNNTVTVTVKAQDGTLAAYGLQITRGPNPISSLSALSVSSGSLSPVFNASVLSYADTVGPAVASLTVTPAGDGLIKVNGLAVASGQASGPIALAVGNNVIAIAVQTAGAAEKDYSVTVVRRQPSSNADLSALTMSSGTLSPAFSAGMKTYSLAVGNAADTLRVSAALADTAARLTVNGVAAASGSPSAVALAVGVNAITVEVTAQNGDKKVYSVQATRAPNANADLSALGLSAGALSPAFAAATLDYSVAVDYGAASLLVTPTCAAVTSVIRVDGALVKSGSASQSLPMALGMNTVGIEVTAQSGAKQAYALHVTRGPKILAIAAGNRHALALRYDGAIIAWGSNDSGQIAVPAGLTGVKAIAAGYCHSAALKSDGTVIAWGDNRYGQTRVPAGLADVKAIAAGFYFTLALKGDGTVAAWGDTTYHATAVPAGLSGVKAIAAGGGHALALKADGTVVAWGYNNNGQTTVPAGLTGVRSISGGGGHSVALKEDSTLVAWGYNKFGQCDIPAGLTGVKGMEAGGSYTLAFKPAGLPIGWGFTASGEMSFPAGLTGIRSMDTGGGFVISLQEDGSVAAWGENALGQTDIPAGVN